MDALLSSGYLAWMVAAGLLVLAVLLWRHPSQNRGRRIFLRAVSLGLLILCAFAMAGSVDYLAQRARDSVQFPPPGRMVNVAGRRLHLHCMGARAGPLAVIVGGLGGPSVMYEGLVAQLAKEGRACVYDRAGEAWSDSGPFPRTLDRQVEELRVLLQTGGERPPFVLIAHSYGGLIARAYAHRVPTELAGLVLADTSVESEIYWLGSTGNIARSISRNRWFAALLPIGLGQIVRRTGDPIGRMFGGAFLAQRDAIYASYSPASFATEASEWAQFVPAANDLYLDRFGTLPVAIISGNQTLPPLVDANDEESRAEQLSQSLSEEGQDRLSRLSTRAWRVRVDSDHLVPQRRPGVILNALNWIKAGPQPNTTGE